MAQKVALTTLNASTIDILNTIRENASLSYYNSIPEITDEHDIPKVGEVLLGAPALMNEFVNALLNRIALVVAKSATFNNPYVALKKGFLEYGETVEEIFVDIAKVRWFSRDKAANRELKRTIPNIKSAFHATNWTAQYPITVEYETLKRAFLSVEGVTDMVSKIVDSLYKATEYDEFLLFKYLLIKAVNAGEIKQVAVNTGTSEANMKAAAAVYRGVSNELTFMSTNYNNAGVLNNTPREKQVIFMDAKYNGAFDVEVLASAFNMDKADLLGRLHLIDNFTTFDNDRWAELRAETDSIEEVSATELSNMAGVVAILVDEDFFQVYDQLFMLTDTEVSAGIYWNYNLNVWKIISWSPFANAVQFGSFTYSHTGVDTNVFSEVSRDEDGNTVLVFNQNWAYWDDYKDTLLNQEACVDAIMDGNNITTVPAIAVTPYGALIVPASAKTLNTVLKIGTATITIGTSKTFATVDTADTATVS